MKRLFLLLLLLSPQAMAGTFHVQWLFRDAGTNVLAIKQVFIQPIAPYGVDGNTVLISGDRLSRQSDSTGSLIVSNLFNGRSYRVELFGPSFHTVFTNSFDTNVTGLVNGADSQYLTAQINDGNVQGYSRNAADARFHNVAGDNSTNAGFYGTFKLHGNATSNYFWMATNVNGAGAWFPVSASAGGMAQTNISVSAVTNAGTAAYSNANAFLLNSTNTATVNNRLEAISAITSRWTTNSFAFADGEIPVPSKRRFVLNGDSYLYGGATEDSFLYWFTNYYPWSVCAGFTNASWPGTPFWPHRTNAWHNGIKQYMLESAGTTTTFDYFIWASGNEANPFQTNGMWLILTNHILSDVRPFAATNTFRIKVWLLGATARENYMASTSQRQGLFHYNNLAADSTNVWDYYIHAADIFTDPSNTNQSADVVHLNGPRYRKLVEKVVWTAYFGSMYKLEPPVERFGSNLYFLNSHGDELAELRGDSFWTQVKMGYPVGNSVGANQPAIAVQPTGVSAPGLSVRGGGSTDAAAFQVENPTGTAKFSIYPTNGNWSQSAGNSSINGGGSLELTGGAGTGGINWWDFGGVGVYYQMKLRSDGAISINDVTNNRAVYFYTNTISAKRDPGGNAPGLDLNLSGGLGDAAASPGKVVFWASGPAASTQGYTNAADLSYTGLVVNVGKVSGGKIQIKGTNGAGYISLYGSTNSGSAILYVEGSPSSRTLTEAEIASFGGAGSDPRFASSSGTITAASNTFAATSFSGSGSVLTFDDEAYDATGWNGDITAPTKNAVRDKIESLSIGATDPRFTSSDGAIRHDVDEQFKRN